MGKVDRFGSKWSQRLLSITRMVTAASFMQHGAQKLFGLPAHPSKVPVELISQLGLAGVLEFFGGLLLLLGLFTRPVAFLLAGEMAVAYFTVHAPKAFWPIVNGGELAILYCFLFLYLSMAGGGQWSLDRHRRHRS